MSNFTKEITIVHRFHNHKYLGSPKKAYCLKIIGYHDVSIIYYYLLKSQVNP